MKKIVILILIIFLTGCNKYITCTVDIENNSMEYKYTAKYKVYSDGKYVTKVEKKETYIARTKTAYKYLKESKELEYDMLSSTYGGYDYNIETTSTGVKIKSTVDFKKLDVKKLVNDKKIDKYYVSGDKVLLSGLKKHYEGKSFVCK